MVDTNRRTLLTAMLALPAFAHAQAPWPSGTVTLVVPAPPGGSLDVIARLMQNGLQQRLGTTVLVDNRGGAGTTNVTGPEGQEDCACAKAGKASMAVSSVRRFVSTMGFLCKVSSLDV